MADNGEASVNQTDGARGVSLPPAESLSFLFEFLLPGLLLNGVGAFGLAGNAAAIAVLSRPQMRGSTNCILIGLATYDIILILSR